MYDRNKDQIERFQPNKNIGDTFENDFEGWTKDLGVRKAKGQYSKYDFYWYNVKIELKQRRYGFDAFEEQLVTKNKVDALVEYPAALYFARFEDNSIYYVDLKKLDLSTLQVSRYQAENYHTDNYNIPTKEFVRVNHIDDIPDIIKQYNEKTRTDKYRANPQD